jgi:hypothetical protein
MFMHTILLLIYHILTMLQRFVDAPPLSRRRSSVCGHCPAMRCGGAGK